MDRKSVYRTSQATRTSQAARNSQAVRHTLTGGRTSNLFSRRTTLNQLPLSRSTARRSTVGRASALARASNANIGQGHWNFTATADWTNASPNSEVCSRTKKEAILSKMKSCSRYMFAFGVLGIIQGIADIEIQYGQTPERVVEQSTCSNRTQKISTSINALEDHSYWILQSNRLLLSLTSTINVLLCLYYHKLEVNLTDIKQRNQQTSWRRFLMLLSVELPINWRRASFWFNMIIAGVHVPPFVTSVPPEAQLVIFLRILTIVKFLRNNHPMKFGNVMELVSTISPVELEDSDFLLKTYFVKYPLSMLFCLYTYVVFVLGYTVFVLERSYGEYKTYFECVWMISVTLPNLGFGDFTPFFVPCRVLVAMTGLLGVLQTGLIVTSITRILSLNKEETKILRFVDRHNVNRVYANAAARLIQARWRLASYSKKQREYCSFNLTRALAKCGCCVKTERYNMMNVLTQRYNNAWRHWRKVKEQKRFQDGLFMTDFLTDTPEVVRENILCELESISEYFGIDQYRQRQPKAQLLEEVDEEHDESPVTGKLQEIEAALGELQMLIRQEEEEVNP